ncbi:MAG: ankyrin repeat domain-containing protein [Candidatus Babeliales bacterium]
MKKLLPLILGLATLASGLSASEEERKAKIQQEFMHAIIREKTDEIEALLTTKADVNTQDPLFGETPLFHAAIGGYGERTRNEKRHNIITLLLEFGVNPNIPNKFNRAVLDILHIKLTENAGDDYTRIPTRDTILTLDEHRKKLDTLYEFLPMFSLDVASIVADYFCGRHGADKAKLHAIFEDQNIKWVFKKSSGFCMVREQDKNDNLVWRIL